MVLFDELVAPKVEQNSERWAVAIAMATWEPSTEQQAPLLRQLAQ